MDCQVGRNVVLLALALLSPGCVPGKGSNPEAVWGIVGTRDGWLLKPRVAAFDSQDRLYIADLTDRIQVFDRDGQFLKAWRLPGLNVDGPSGITIDAEGRVMVADTHFYRILIYDSDGNLVQQLGDGVQGIHPRPVRLSDRRRARLRGQLLRGRIRRERPHPGFLP